MATKVKPSRINITGTPQVGQVPVYVDDNCFCWGQNGAGDVTGPASSTDGNVAVFDGCTGKAIKDSGKSINCLAQLCDIPTDNCQLSNGCSYLKSCDLPDLSGYQLKCNMVCDLTGADNNHYPSAKAVADALSCAGAGDMLKSTYDPNNHNADAFDYCNFTNTPTIPTDNCQLANGCGYTTCTGTLQACDIANLAQCCDIPTNNNQLTNGCGYTTCTGTLSSCADIISALGYTPYSSANPSGYTSCTGTLVPSDLNNYAKCCDIPTDNCQLGNGCGYTTCTGTLQSCDIACINGCCLTGGGDICISGGADYSWQTKTITGGEVELGLRTIVNPPTSDFTLTAPATLQEGEEYVIRTISETSYCMCLGSCFTNPWNVDTCLSGKATDQYVFLAIGGELELQPLVATGS